MLVAFSYLNIENIFDAGYNEAARVGLAVPWMLYILLRCATEGSSLSPAKNQQVDSIVRRVSRSFQSLMHWSANSQLQSLERYGMHP